MKTTFQYDHYYKYDELKNCLEFFAKEYPDICQTEVNCVTEMGLNQYVVTLTNQKTGEALSKPGWYLDGNIHAGEVTASMTAMHTIDYLVTNYGTDPRMHRFLDTMTIYVIPRVTPDGAETYLSTPYTLRSVDRAYLPEKGGIKPEDLDGDGVIRMMLIPSAYGAWKKDPSDEQASVSSPSDTDGEFYDIYPEGISREYDGDENLKQKKPDWGLDFNRNFPYGWFPDARQAGAGKYPLSNPETKAIVDFVFAHPNIGGAACGHTSGGIILYPPGTRPSTSAPNDDIKVLQGNCRYGQRRTRICTDESGALDDWFYQNQGIPSYTMEFWNIAEKAGMPYDWFSSEAETPEKALERFNACMKWVKENAPQYLSDWQEFDHPTFGKVELGGFNYKFTHQNPPEHLLVKECENDTKFNIRFAKAMPKLKIDSLTKKEVGKGIYEVTAVVGNPGYLPTNLTDEAVKLKVNKPVTVSIEGGTLLAGKQTEEIGDLSGYSRTMTGSFYGNITTFANAKAKKKVVWVVQANEGDKICVSACQEKAGKACAEIVL